MEANMKKIFNFIKLSFRPILEYFAGDIIFILFFIVFTIVAVIIAAIVKF